MSGGIGIFLVGNGAEDDPVRSWRSLWGVGHLEVLLGRAELELCVGCVCSEPGHSLAGNY